MTDGANPWVDRFEPLLDRTTLKDRATVTIPALVDLHALPLELAARKVEAALETIFHPSSQCLDVLTRLVGVAHAHCQTTYRDLRTFLEGVYAASPPLRDFWPPICLTGLAGTGKTQLLKAFYRVLEEEGRIEVDSFHPPFALRGIWRTTIQARGTPKDVLRSLAKTEGSPGELVEMCRKLAYRDGVASAIADEFQFATGATERTRA